MLRKQKNQQISWSIRSQMLYKLGVCKHFTKFTVKQLCWSLF